MTDNLITLRLKTQRSQTDFVSSMRLISHLSSHSASAPWSVLYCRVGTTNKHLQREGERRRVMISDRCDNGLSPVVAFRNFNLDHT